MPSWHSFLWRQRVGQDKLESSRSAGFARSHSSASPTGTPIPCQLARCGGEVFTSCNVNSLTILVNSANAPAGGTRPGGQIGPEPMGAWKYTIGWTDYSKERTRIKPRDCCKFLVKQARKKKNHKKRGNRQLSWQLLVFCRRDKGSHAAMWLVTVRQPTRALPAAALLLLIG